VQYTWSSMLRVSRFVTQLEIIFLTKIHPLIRSENPMIDVLREKLNYSSLNIVCLLFVWSLTQL
jgi:hypothetical protein